MVELLRRRDMIAAGESGPQPILLFDNTVSSAAATVYTSYFDATTRAQLAEAATLTLLIWPVYVDGDPTSQTIQPRINNQGIRTENFCSNATVLFSATNDKSTYAKFIRPVKSEWSTTSTHWKKEYTNSSGVITTTTGTYTIGGNSEWRDFTNKFRFAFVAGTKFAVGTRMQAWLDLDPLWL